MLPPIKPLELPKLPYDVAALEPVISAEIMQLHYSKHHQAYVTNYNAALEKLSDACAKEDVAAIIALQPTLRFNGGGHVNHSIFWTNLAPPKTGGTPSGKLKQEIETEFGSLEECLKRLSQASIGIQGSGWGWLGWSRECSRLVIATCANQDPLSTQGLVPLLGIDVWEHAYYLQYKNVRAEYVKNILTLVNWKNVEERLARLS